MGVRTRIIVVSMMALCLVCAMGAAGVAYADETTPLASGEIAEGLGGEGSSESQPATDPDPDPDPEPQPVHAGWEKIGSSWTYWWNNEQVKGQFVNTDTAPGIKGIPSGIQKYWIAANGKLAVGRLVHPESSGTSSAKGYYYATKRGYIAKGKTVVGDRVYLANSRTGRLASGNSQGFLSTKAYDNATKRRYYIDPRLHAAVTGKIVKVKGFGKVFAYPKKGYLLTGLTKVDKTHLVLASKDGKLCNKTKAGWVSTSAYAGGDKQRYYLNRTTKYKSLYGARIGAFKVNGKRYFGQSKGYVFRNGYKQINGKYYHADKKGALTYDRVVTRMCKKAQGYSSPSRYLLMVDIDNPKTIVFEGSKNKWKVKFIWDCCTGAPATPTVVGTFSVGIKGPSFGEDRGFSCYTYTQISGDYLFHTRIYYAGTHTLMEKDNLGNRHSHGCVHLLDENARWIQNNVPSGTTIACIR